MKIQCELGCSKIFELNDVAAKFQYLPKKVERHYIECPHCQKQYTSYYLNEPMKVLQRKIRTLSEKGMHTTKQKNKFTQMKGQLGIMMDQLKKDHEGND
ncbi:hypothetical protein [Alkalibacillus almallahensis]|uniref:hypothetical protein n=1 Tax=Alkalibacillus almallahensis TaxID=1379154 RepID=UPI001422ED48|nr:hypothetical protein [Alkalibacillus almallahensis]NIK10913.1 hypothetical protein [Alkalibacillus almallahensis]